MLTQDGLIKKLQEWGEKTTTQMLRDREKKGLTGVAYRGGAGRPGRSVFYPERVLWENYAASKMLRSKKMRLTAEEVGAARALALRLESEPIEVVEQYYNKPEAEQLDLRFAEIWHSLVVAAWLGCPSVLACEVIFGHGASTQHRYSFTKGPVSMDTAWAYVQVNPRTQKFVLQSSNGGGKMLNDEDIINHDALF